MLAFQESTRQAAFGRPDMLEGLFEQAQEIGRRAAALEVAAVEPKDGARGVVLGAVMNLAVPGAEHDVPAAAVVMGSEPVLVEALSRARDWLGGSLHVSAEPAGSWWKLRLSSSGVRTPLAVPEMGEPLLRLIVDTQLDGWLDVRSADSVDIYLPAYRPR